MSDTGCDLYAKTKEFIGKFGDDWFFDPDNKFYEEHFIDLYDYIKQLYNLGFEHGLARGQAIYKSKEVGNV